MEDFDFHLFRIILFLLMSLILIVWGQDLLVFIPKFT